MTPDLSTIEGRAAFVEACEKTIRLAYQRGSATTRTQHPQDVIDDAKIVLAALDEIERLAGIVDQLRTANTNLMAYERDHAAMEALRRLKGEVWAADIGTWGYGEASDPADAVMEAYEIELEHMKTDPVKMEHRG